MLEQMAVHKDLQCSEIFCFHTGACIAPHGLESDSISVSTYCQEEYDKF